LTEANADTGSTAPTVVVLADDLIWATRLADAVAAAGGLPARRRRLEDLDPAAAFVIVDLTARAYDGVTAIRQAAGTGARVVAVGQHDDAALRRAAIEAGAERVFTYRSLFEDGPRALARWLGR
jgi:DNA-binding NarL/FixJ family response regulator